MFLRPQFFRANVHKEDKLKKIVIKTALITLASVIAVLALAFGVASLAFPKGMSKMCEDMGNYKLAASYAERQYGYSGSTEDLYRCARLYIRIGDRDNTIKYCEELVQKQDFKEVCGDNVQYVYSNYSTDLYLSGKTDEAIAVAEKSVEDGFEIPNAYADLTVKAVENSDKEFGADLYASFLKIEEPSGGDFLKYYNAVKNQLERLIGVN